MANRAGAEGNGRRFHSRPQPSEWRRAAELRGRSIQHALRLRRRRSADLDQRRSARACSAFPHDARGRRGHARDGEIEKGPRASACVDRTAQDGRSTRRVGRDLVIAAGGIGLAPLRSVICHALARRSDFGQVVLLLGARTPQDICFKGELRRWRARHDLQVHITVDHASGNWRGDVGVVTKLIPHARFDPANTIALMCGPEVMMRFTALELQKRGVPLDHIYASLERNMKCAIGFCGHCQFGPTFICKDGPVFRYDRVKPFLVSGSYEEETQTETRCLEICILRWMSAERARLRGRTAGDRGARSRLRTSSKHRARPLPALMICR